MRTSDSLESGRADVLRTAARRGRMISVVFILVTGRRYVL